MATKQEIIEFANETLTMAENTDDPAKREEYLAIFDEAMASVQGMPDEPAAEPVDTKSPATNSYEGMPYDQAMEKYEQYTQDPSYEEASWLGGAIGGHSGTVTNAEGQPQKVFKPAEDIITGEAYMPSSATRGSMITETARNVGQLAGAGMDWLTEKLPDAGSIQFKDEEGNIDIDYLSAEETKERQEKNPDYMSLQAAVEQNIPKSSTGGDISDTLLVEGIPTLLGGAGAFGLADKALKAGNAIRAAKTSGQVLKGARGVLNTAKEWVIKNVASAGGVAATSPTDAGTVLVGEDNLLGTNLGFYKDLPEDPTARDSVLAKRMDIFTDAVLGSAIFDTVTAATGLYAVVRNIVVDPIRNAASLTRQQNAVVRKILDQFALVDETTDATTAKEIKEAAIQAINDNKEVVLDIGDATVAPRTVKLDTASALREGAGDTELGTAVADKAAGIREGLISKGDNELRRAVDAPTTATREILEEGAAGTEMAGAVPEAGMEQYTKGMAEAQAIEDVARENLSQAEKALVTTMREDPTVGAAVEALEKSSGVNITSGKVASEDEIVAGIRQGIDGMVDRRNTLFGEVQGGFVDGDALVSQLMDASPYVRGLLKESLPPDNTFRKLIEASTPQPKTTTNAAGETIETVETAEEVAERMKEFIQENNIDYGVVFRDVRRFIADAKSNLFGNVADASAKDKAAAGTLDRWIKYIDNEMVDDLASAGDQSTIDALDQAMDFYKYEFMPILGGGALGDVYKKYQGTVARTGKEMAERGQEILSSEFQDVAIKSLQTGLREENRSMAGQFIDLLQRSETPLDPRDLAEYAVADVLSEFAPRIVSGKAGEINVGELAEAFRKYNSLLEKFPEQQARIADLFETLKAASKNVDEYQQELETALVASKSARDRINNTVFADLVQSYGGQIMPIDNPVGYLRSLYRGEGKDSITKLNDLVRTFTENGDEAALQGMRQVYYDTVLDTVFSNTAKQQAAVVKIGTTSRALDNNAATLLDNADIVFPNNPEAAEGVRAIVEFGLGIDVGKRARAIAGTSNTAFTQQAAKTVDRLVMTFVGPLTRLGARIRSATGTALEKMAPDQAAQQALSIVMRDPEEFTRIANRVMALDYGLDANVVKRINAEADALPPELRGDFIQKAYADIGITPAQQMVEMGRVMFPFLVKAGIYNDYDQEAYMDALVDVANVEREGRTAVMQTKEALGIDPAE